ncbi:hypothetical protein GCM10010218_34960 [Streptomyces mashuensis]|uniref:MmpS family membrane protein n=1 Tax=Streptomyces mashuensis TaxID=33904 RepID=A0A919B5C9_9ACTN|nr:MmpS family protein [Streptomyces mashuensis]GHF50426.1 hypothetical protein GCM10010218_34960 [Streptomyces mashuensis]
MKPPVRIRTTLCAFALALGGGLALTGCGEDGVSKKSYEVTYEVSGKDVASIVFNEGKGSISDPDMSTEDRPKVPWTRTVTLKGLGAPTLTVTSGSADGDATCKISYKGKVLQEKTAKGAGELAQCSVVSPMAD